MKIVQMDNQFMVYGDGLKTYDILPAGVYMIRFGKMTGFFLEGHAPLETKEKVYGPHEEKVDKVLQTFRIFERNLGVILSGDKGIGKSMFAKLLAEKATAAGYPVLIADQYYPGIESYLESIQQEAVVLFDEFDKTFAQIKGDDNSPNAQAKMLTLFDGMSMGKKLFVITCNSLRALSEYLVNRPGRFHYHFRFGYPTPDEIDIYMRDHLDPAYYGEIPNVIRFAARVEMNYDCLRAIAFELNFGRDFKSAIRDLNIIHTDESQYEISVICSNGTAFKAKTVCDLFDEDAVIDCWLSASDGSQPIRCAVPVKNLVYDAHSNAYEAEAGMFEIKIDEYEDPKVLATVKGNTPLRLMVKRCSTMKNLHYAV